jgi:glycylpeptide N-tetradecanoyltransferase
MASSQKAKIEEIIDATERPETSDDPSASEPEDDDHDDDNPILNVTQDNQPSTSQKKKKKKKSKAKQALNALRGKKEIPQELVDVVLDKVKAEHGEGAPEADEANIRMVLEHMKIMDVVQGKAGIGGKGKKDMGEHKVCNMAVSVEYIF